MLVQEHGKQLDVGGAGLAERGGRDLPLATREVVVNRAGGRVGCPGQLLQPRRRVAWTRRSSAIVCTIRWSVFTDR